MRGFDTLRALLGFEYPPGSWFRAIPSRGAGAKRGTPFGGGKVRPVILATDLRPDAVLYPRSTKRSGNSFEHAAHSHDPPGPCAIKRPGWVVLAVPVTVDTDDLNEKTYSCEEPEDSPLLDELRKALRP
ncbi:MAG: hypothetical protein OXN89_06555 [Bryobacterales bacterium]|nr:hypothetical protein [Bryobacterales bacterium]